MNKDLKVGDRVILSLDHLWGESENNPSNTEGTVVSFDAGDDPLWLDVLWINGKENSYKTTDSDLVRFESLYEIVP